MMEQYVEPCIYCHKDIVFSEDSSVVVCSACGRKMAISSFQSRQLQMRKALEEGEAAKENLKAAEQAKQEANERLFSVISALSDIQSSKENTEETC